MPLYSYTCPACGTSKEVLQRDSAPAPVCAEHGDMVRDVGAPSFHLKGTGWYKPGASR